MKAPIAICKSRFAQEDSYGYCGSGPGQPSSGEPECLAIDSDRCAAKAGGRTRRAALSPPRFRSGTHRRGIALSDPCAQRALRGGRRSPCAVERDDGAERLHSGWADIYHRRLFLAPALRPIRPKLSGHPHRTQRIAASGDRGGIEGGNARYRGDAGLEPRGSRAHRFRDAVPIASTPLATGRTPAAPGGHDRLRRRRPGAIHHVDGGRGPSDRVPLLGTHRAPSERNLCDLVGGSCPQYGSGWPRRHHPLLHGLPALVVGGPAQCSDADPDDGRRSGLEEIRETGASGESVRRLY
jgi:hypothetical protein